MKEKKLSTIEELEEKLLKKEYKLSSEEKIDETTKAVMRKCWVLENKIKDLVSKFEEERGFIGQFELAIILAGAGFLTKLFYPEYEILSLDFLIAYFNIFAGYFLLTFLMVIIIQMFKRIFKH